MLKCKKMPHRGPRMESWESGADRLAIRTIRQSEVEDQEGRLEVIPLTDRIIRVRYTEGTFDDSPSDSLVPLAPDAAWSVDEDAGGLWLRTPCLQVRIERETCRLRWLDEGERLITEEPEDGGKWLQKKEVYRTEWSTDAKVIEEMTVDGTKQRMVGEGRQVLDRMAWSSTLKLSLQPDEAIYGLGQHEDGIFDYSRQRQFLYQSNMKVAMPTFVSSAGYAIHQDQHCLATFEADGETLTWGSDVVPQLDFHFIHGPSFDEIVKGLRLLTGGLPMLPRWAYGFIQSKERYETAAELIATARRFREEKMPLDCIVLDWSSWEPGQWGQKSLDPERFPDPEAMMEALHAMDVRLMISIWPNMKEGGPDHAQMREAGCLMANQMTCDSTREEAQRLYWKQAKAGLFDHGIDAWWCDCTEPFESDWYGSARKPAWKRMVDCVSEFKKFMDPGSINAYSLNHARAIHKGQRNSGSKKRVVNLTRSSGPSQQRYGTITWSGDIEARWSRLRRQLADGLNFVVTGNPRWTFDIGGFFVKPGIPWFWDGQYPAGTEDLGYRELYTRWFQTGCFLPMFRSHGTDTAREFWNFGEPGTPFRDTIRFFTELRYRLLPYIYSLSAMEVFRDYTLFRSLVFDFREDPETHRISDQFMLGPALMVCPVLEPMYYGPHSKPLEDRPRTRRVYLPKTTSWYDFWTGKHYPGGQWLDADAPLERLPLFVPEGSILPLGPVLQHSGETANAPLEVHVYPGKSTRFELYEDAGDGHGWESGEYAWTPLVWDETKREYSTGEPTGRFKGHLTSRPVQVRIQKD